MQENKELRYYENIHQATLFSFKSVIDNNDFRYLLKLKDYDSLPEISQELEDALADVWYNIYSEYSEITGDSSASLQFVETKRLAVKKHKIGYLSQALSFIGACQDQELADMLKEDGLFIDYTSPENFSKSYSLAIGKLSKMKLQLNRSEPEIIEDKNSLDLLITELEKFQGYQFNENEMKVSKFAYIVKRYKDARQDKKG